MQVEARRSGDFIWFRRCAALLYRGQGYTQESVAKGLGVCIRAVQKWEALFLAEGAKALKPKKSPGRPSKLSKKQKKLLYQKIEAGPQACGYKGGVWTAAMIQDYIQKSFGVFYSVKYLSQLLRNMGLSHIKPKFSYSLTREQLKKHVLWIRQKYPQLFEEMKKTEGVILFLDESVFQLQSNLAQTWAPKGDPPIQERNPKRKWLRVLGCIELFTGTLTYTIVEKSLKNDVFATFLKRVAKRYAGREVFIVQDNAPYHGGKHVEKFKERPQHVHLCPLPQKAPHLNPIEKLWKEIKRNWTHNVYFATKESLKSAVRKGLHFYQEHPELVKSLIKKWEKVGVDPEGALRGDYDTSLVPDKYLSMLQEVLQEIHLELKKAS